MEYLQAVTLVNMDVLEYIGASSYKAVSGISQHGCQYHTPSFVRGGIINGF